MNRNIIYQVDSFTSLPFRGNPAGVMIVDSYTTESWMQNIAMEMNLSETAFVRHNGKDFSIRFFTPQREEPLCGHATLASAHILYETGLIKETSVINFKSKGGNLIVHRENPDIVMSFPVYPIYNFKTPKEFRSIIGFEPIEMYSSIYDWTIAIASSEDDIVNAEPVFDKMIQVGLGNLMITAESSKINTDFVVRCFSPLSGINEDPVTGSAHCALAPLWHSKTGKKDFNSLQLSNRTGRLKINFTTNSVVIRGQAVTIFEANLKI